MGVYDCYGKEGVQIKLGPCELKDYVVGDPVEIADGVYVGHEGVIVIKEGMFVAEFPHVMTKWGDCIEPKEILNPHDEVAQACHTVVEQSKPQPVESLQKKYRLMIKKLSPKQTDLLVFTLGTEKKIPSVGEVHQFKELLQSHVLPFKALITTAHIKVSVKKRKKGGKP